MASEAWHKISRGKQQDERVNKCLQDLWKCLTSFFTMSFFIVGWDLANCLHKKGNTFHIWNDPTSAVVLLAVSFTSSIVTVCLLACLQTFNICLSANKISLCDKYKGKPTFALSLPCKRFQVLGKYIWRG